MRSPFELHQERSALLEKREQIQRDLESIHRDGGDAPLSAGAEERFTNLSRGAEKLDQQLRSLEDELSSSALEHARTNPQATESIDFTRPDAVDRQQEDGTPPHVRQGRDAALRTIDSYAAEQRSDAVDRVERVVRADTSGGAARYVAAVGAPAYASAFAKIMADPTMGHLRFSHAEVEAMRLATAAQAEQRAFTTTTTGVPIPYQLDPSIMISGSGALNPLRQIARVETVTEGTWKGATSAEVSAAYAAEGTEASDNTPAMTQPSIVTARGQAFIPFSFEVGQDWGTVVEELSRLLADGRDVVDATQMLTGTGTNAPGGILNIGGTGGLTTAQRVQSGTTNVIALADLYALKQALPPRFMADATWAFHPTRLDSVYRLVASGSTTEPQIMSAGRDGPLLGKPVVEWSTMATAATTTVKWAIYGNFRNFLIADRLGTTVELVPHLFGATNRFPTGQKGLFMIWRTGTGVLVPNALRYGEVL